jgi:penicillin amidase
VDLWFDDPEHPVWNDRSTSERETRAEIVRPAFVRALRWLQEELGGSDPTAWHWGELHTLQSQHALGSKLDAFNLPSRMAPGASASVWKAHFDLGRSDHPYRCLYGPVLRMIVDLADIEHAFWTIDTGSSGWPGSPHYGNQHELWWSTKHAPMVSNWKEVKRDAVAVLTLR